MSMNPFFEQLQTGNIPTLEASMKYEGLRLATFHKRPRAYKFPAIKLAKAGFYYLGENDLVSCFKCDLKIDDWGSFELHTNPLEIHKKRSPRCAFVNDDKENVPYVIQNSAMPEEARKVKEVMEERKQTHEQRTFQQRVHKPYSNNTPSFLRQISADSSDPPLRPSQSPASAHSTTVTAAGTPSVAGQRSPFLHQAYNVPRPSFETPPPPPMFDNDLHGMPNFKSEQIRLETFNYWPNGSSVRPAELAKAGFYYLGTEDRVQCAFCKGVLRNWDPTDHALEEHKKHFPACPFIRDSKGVGNVPVLDNLKGVTLRRDMPSDQELEEYLLGIMTERAYHPHMAMKVERLNSFINFYSDSSRSPDEFAEAGFFFTGQGDNVKCFFCDGGLRNWERNDDPWLEHARWFPKCGYLRTKKGEEYVKDIRKRFAPPGTKKPKIRKLKSKYTVKLEVINKFMNGQIAADAMDIGFAKEQIKNIVHQRYAQFGEVFPNVESLIDSLYEAEELAQQGSSCESDDESGDFQRDTSSVDNTEEVKADAATNEKSEKKKHKKKKKKKKQEPVAQVNPIDYMSEEKGAELSNEVQKMRDERMCKVCMDSEVNIVFLKCGHLVCCSDCAPALRHCPICRDTIRGTIRVFIP